MNIIGCASQLKEFIFDPMALSWRDVFEGILAESIVRRFAVRMRY
jgi:hypothetical protein